MSSTLRLSRQIEEKYEENKQTKATYERKLELKQKLETLLRSKIPDLNRIYIFGSSANNLGTNKSDVDMLVQSRSSEMYPSSTLRSIHSELTKLRVYNLELINAKVVPIVRFKSESGITVDLSANNPNGVRNTHLLHCYTKLDERFAPLVVIIKLWAKKKDINDPFHNTLSSYGYVLLVIHYLQCGCTPPVLPNLISMMPHIFYANSDISTLDDNQRLPYYESSNKQSLGELLLGFFRYYTQEFDFDRDAVSIKDAQRVNKSVVRKTFRDWETICIQDPFNLQNAGRNCWKSYAYSRIKTAFRTSYEALARSNDLDAII